MKRMPRNARRSAFVVLSALCLCFLCQTATAQQRNRNRTKTTSKAQSSETERARRARALTLLAETADEARAIDDLLYRARLQALAADALWPFDPQRARVVFRRAWEAATASDKAEREQEAQASGVTLEAIEPVTEARDEVLSKAAARSPALAEIFLRDLSKETESASAAKRNEDAPSSAWREPSAAAARRLALGLELLDKGETENALAVVSPIVREGASASLMTFLLRLHAQNSNFGQSLYQKMVEQMRQDGGADTNAVLLLSTPIVSPGLMLAVNEYGTLQFRPVANAATNAEVAPAIAPNLRRLFLSAAAVVLLRPAILRPGTSEVQDKVARYFAIKRLLPFYEREAAQFAPELHARSNAILNEFTENYRDLLLSQFNLRSLAPPPSTDPLRSHFEERERTSEAAERERITLRIVLTAARNRFWDRARRAAAELSDESVRRAANSFIAVNQIADISRAYADEKEDDYESIVSFLKSVEVPPLAAAWGYAQAAHVAARKKEAQRVAELLTEAEHYAERVELNTKERIAAYGVIAQHAARLNQQRAWELLTKLVKAANAAEDYAGDEASIEIRTDERAPVESESPFTLALDRFRLDTIFATMARLDFERALSNARALEAPVPRNFAQLAIARALLEKK